VVNGGTLQFNRLNQGTYDLPFNDVTINAGANLALGSIDPNGGAFFNKIQGAGSLTITTSYLVLLTEDNNYTGGTTITNGATASITRMSSLGANGTPIRFKGSGERSLGYAGGLWFEIGDHVTPSVGTFSHPITVDGWKIALLNAAGNDITLDQPISGDGIIQYSNGGFGGTFRLNAANTYKGVSQIDSGTKMVIGVDNALPTSGTALLGTASLDLNGHNQTLNYIVSAAGTPEIKLTNGNLTIKNDIEDPFGGAWGGKITGNGALIKTGGGTSVFNVPAGEASTYTGGTTVEQGTLQILGNVNALPAGGPVTIGKDGNLQFTTDAVSSGLTAGTPVTFSGNISGAGEVQITSLETVVLSGNNTYSGGTRLSNGWLRVNADGNLGAPTGKITFASNGSNPGPILQYGAAFNSTRDVVVDTANAFVDTAGFNVALGNVDTNPLLPQGSFNKLAGSGTLTVKHARVNGLTVSAGGLAIAASGGAPSGTSTANTVVVAAGAKLDLKDNKLITNTAVGTGAVGGGDYTAGSVSRMVQTGSNGGAWDGSGIMTTMPDATAGLTSIGVALASDVRDFGAGTTLLFAGQTITPTSTLAMYTYAGDANLDGQITGDDYAGIDFTILDPNNTGGWFNGDFNYDGFVSGDDYSAIDFNILAQGAPFPTGGAAASLSGGVTPVPEPGSCGLLVLAGAMLGRRVRRERRRNG
jgi:autotransporter-associated beta strand protein